MSGIFPFSACSCSTTGKCQKFKTKAATMVSCNKLLFIGSVLWNKLGRAVMSSIMRSEQKAFIAACSCPRYFSLPVQVMASFYLKIAAQTHRRNRRLKQSQSSSSASTKPAKKKDKRSRGSSQDSEEKNGLPSQEMEADDRSKPKRTKGPR